MKFCDLLIFAGCLGAASTSSALSLGDSQGNVLLGSNVDLVFHVQADPGQTADSSCVSAEVWLGDVRLGSSQVQLQALSNSAVRVRTLLAVNEPLVNIKLTAGCAGSVSRSYPFLADPPLSMAASLTPIDLSKIQVASLPPATSALPQPHATRPALAAAPNKPRPAKRQVHAQSPSRASASTATAPLSGAAPLPLHPTTATSTGLTNATATAAPLLSEHPKLRMEALDGLLAPSTETSQPADIPPEAEHLPRSASIDIQTQTLLDTNAQRLELLEQQLQNLQSTLTSNRTEITSLRNQLAQTHDEGLPLWVNVMLGLLALALATIAWLLQRIKQERTQAQARWDDTVMAAQDEVLPSNAPLATPQPPAHAAVTASPATASWASVLCASESTSVAPSNSPASLAHPAVPDAEWLEKASQDTHQAGSFGTPHTAATSTPAQEPGSNVLTAQALFDIQEQAEFYASIGEHNQAIELLETHIAQNAHSSPLAYLELLQLLYRLSRTEAFERVSEQFQRYFNVKVPNFLRFARKGHDLWSSHPEVLSEIEALWPTDQVLALLHQLILVHPHTDIAKTQRRFDLAAFDDLLMLYNVAQTTPAATRGSITERIRTAPQEAPLPEVLPEESVFAAQTEFMPDDVFFKNSATPPSSAPLAQPQPEADFQAWQSASLELLSTAPAQTPLVAAPAETTQPETALLANSAVLIDELSIDWEGSHASPTIPAISETAASATLPKLPEFTLSDPLLDTPLSSDALLNDPLLSDPSLNELQLDEFMIDERDLPSAAPQARR